MATATIQEKENPVVVAVLIIGAMFVAIFVIHFITREWESDQNAASTSDLTQSNVEMQETIEQLGLIMIDMKEDIKELQLKYGIQQKKGL